MNQVKNVVWIDDNGTIIYRVEIGPHKVYLNGPSDPELVEDAVAVLNTFDSLDNEPNELKIMCVQEDIERAYEELDNLQKHIEEQKEHLEMLLCKQHRNLKGLINDVLKEQHRSLQLTVIMD